MSLNKIAVCLAASVLPITASESAKAEGIACPAVSGTHLRYVQVFDGKPEEKVSLIAEHGDNREGYWKLGYVYDQGRSVTVQCVYANKETRDIAIPERVDTCRYQIDDSGATKMDCK
ncbi:hypothetical protein NK8_51850 (plasmid) [Caballeronia sp. NK8]|uniref:STY0301 family protein n=1 Tax=Caballeronia sp. NK8 TaxID=140098 RepID=UPI001BB54172|nr:STY0301 family protein [Caballeronia sp. NK8]BCQ26996.1 hypothetical protein NK8_51850 [Caballeronia sp. NK8]